ncbi:VOC family protein [Niabella insulamsoli]|uniref:VOC family protein n=1 Tax=Niabella insulamsoli TaxID=3144874 RepID=UPI0031FC5B06
MKIAKGHQPVMPYLILKNAMGFIDFTRKVFGAEEVFKSFRDNDNQIIMHAEVRINGCNIMFADMNEFYSVANANLFIYVDDADETVRIALENGAKIINELADQDYGRSGGIEDPFGNVWWVTSMNGE